MGRRYAAVGAGFSVALCRALCPEYLTILGRGFLFLSPVSPFPNLVRRKRKRQRSCGRRVIVLHQLKMQMWLNAIAGVSDRGDRITGLHSLAPLHLNTAFSQMGEQCVDAAVGLHDEMIAQKKRNVSDDMPLGKNKPCNRISNEVQILSIDPGVLGLYYHCIKRRKNIPPPRERLRYLQRPEQVPGQTRRLVGLTPFIDSDEIFGIAVMSRRIQECPYTFHRALNFNRSHSLRPQRAIRRMLLSIVFH